MQKYYARGEFCVAKRDYIIVGRMNTLLPTEP
jgi:hypothetical protein